MQKSLKNDRKRAKNLIQISQVFNTSKWIFISGLGSLGHFKKFNKNYGN
jgi:hypothetical protein